MARRIFRTILQLAAVVTFTFMAVLILDRNYRVLPNSIHHHMPSHHPGLVVVDVTVAACSPINIFSSCDLDPSTWRRIDKDLYLGHRSWTSRAYLFVSRKREEDLGEDDSVVVGMAVGRLNPGTQPGLDGWEAREAGIWIKRSHKKKASDSDVAVTDVDVLFGDDAVEARESWAITGTPLLLDSPPHTVHLTIRRGAPHEHKKLQPRIRDNGRFKIMQIADLHLSTGVGDCREAIPDSYNGGPCEADPRTLDFVTKMLDEEKPDFVVLTGDQVNGETAPDAQSAMFKYASILAKRKILHAAIFGNHDDKTLSRASQMAIMEALPYSLSIAGPGDISGVGNYVVEVLGKGSSEHSALTLYMLDTHAYTPDKHYEGYDWIKPDQVEWFRETSKGLQSKHQEFTRRHMDLAFIHIPLPEYTSHDLPRVGNRLEAVMAPHFNSHFRDALVEQGVVMVSAGHDHCNDYCSLSLEGTEPALWMCYGGGVGFGGYAGYGGYHRRLRLFEVDVNEARITTWKRLEYGDIEHRIDEQIIVDGGKPVRPKE